MNSHVIYSFGDYRLDPAKRELWRGDARVPAQPKVFEVLAYLVEHRDRAVGKDELVAGVWGKAEVSDNVLGQIVGRARHAVGDTGEDQRAIRTVNRVGYSWILPVEAAEIQPILNGNGNGNGIHTEYATATAHGTAPSVSAAREPSAAATGTTRRRLAAGALVLVLIAIAITAAIALRDRAPLAVIDGETALVLPVTVVGDEGASWIRLGVMDLIADRLRAAGQAVVPSDNTVALARSLNESAEPNPDQIEALARAALVGLVMDAKAEMNGDHWRVTLRVVHGRERRLVAQGADDDVLAAARAAADRMAVMLGYPLADSSAASSDEPDLDRVLQQVKAAMLSDRFEEARELLAGVDAGLRSGPRIRDLLANIDLQANRLDEAQAAFEALIRDVSADVDPLMHARALKGLAHTFNRRFDYVAAETRYTEAVDLLGRTDGYETNKILGGVLMGRAGSHGFQGELEAAQADYARARVAYQSIGDQLALAKLENNLALMFSLQARYAEAIPHVRHSAERLAVFGDVQSELRARLILAVAHSALLDAPAALAETRHFDELLAQVSSPGLETEVNGYRVDILFDNGHVTAAMELLRRMFDRGAEPGTDIRVHWPQAILAGHALRTGRPALAAREAESALQGSWDLAAADIQAHARLTLLRAQLALERIEAAAETIADATAWAKTAANPLADIYINLMHAEYAASTGDAETAGAGFRQALRQADARGVPAELLQVAEPYTAWLIGQGELDRASVVAGRVANWASKHYGAALLQVRLYHALGEPVAWRTALDRTSALAGEREIPRDLLATPLRRVATIR